MVELHQLWSSLNTTPPWLEALLRQKMSPARLVEVWPPSPSIKQAEVAALAWCDRQPSGRASRAARLNRLPFLPCYENRQGAACDVPVRSFCVNQCSGQGECLSGFCRCEGGWTGVDCSIPLVPPANEGAGASTVRWQAALPTTPPLETPPLPRPPPRRPSVYVYELPVRFNTWLMESRVKTHDCVYRTYTGAENATQWVGCAFGMEIALHELLLASPHRTLDPSSADFYFLPLYGGCQISRYFRPTPAHSLFLRRDGIWTPAPVLGNRFYRRALRWIRRHHPYWDRSNGTDHLVAFPHDEGACIAPIEMRNAILLTSWGRLEPSPCVRDSVRASVRARVGGERWVLGWAVRGER